MPTVKRYQTNRNVVKDHTPSTPKQKASVSQGSFGENYQAKLEERLGQGLTQAGQSYIKYYVHSEDRKDRIMARDALNSARMDVAEGFNQIKRTSGIDAFSVTEGVVDKVGRGYRDKLQNKNQLEYFDARWQDIKLRAMETSLNFQEKTRRTMELQSLDRDNQAAVQEIIMSIDATPEIFNKTQQEAERRIASNIAAKEGVTVRGNPTSIYQVLKMQRNNPKAEEAANTILNSMIDKHNIDPSQVEPLRKEVLKGIKQSNEEEQFIGRMKEIFNQEKYWDSGVLLPKKQIESKELDFSKDEDFYQVMKTIEKGVVSDLKRSWKDFKKDFWDKFIKETQLDNVGSAIKDHYRELTGGQELFTKDQNEQDKLRKEEYEKSGLPKPVQEALIKREEEALERVRKGVDLNVQRARIAVAENYANQKSYMAAEGYVIDSMAQNKISPLEGNKLLARYRVGANEEFAEKVASDFKQQGMSQEDQLVQALKYLRSKDPRDREKGERLRYHINKNFRIEKESDKLKEDSIYNSSFEKLMQDPNKWSLKDAVGVSAEKQKQLLMLQDSLLTKQKKRDRDADLSVKNKLLDMSPSDLKAKGGASYIGEQLKNPKDVGDVVKYMQTDDKTSDVKSEIRFALDDPYFSVLKDPKSKFFGKKKGKAKIDLETQNEYEQRKLWFKQEFDERWSQLNKKEQSTEKARDIIRKLKEPVMIERPFYKKNIRTYRFMYDYLDAEDQDRYKEQNPPQNLKHIKNLEFSEGVYHYKDASGTVFIHAPDGEFIQSNRPPKRK